MKRAPATLSRRSWKRLPARERLMWTLLCYEKLSPTEVARSLGCSVRDVVRTLESRLAALRRRTGRAGVRRAASGSSRSLVAKRAA